MSGAARHVVATIDACFDHDDSHPGEPHLRRSMPWRDSRQPQRWLWCLGHYDQRRQNRRVVVAVTDEAETLVGEGLTEVGSAYRTLREPHPVSAGGCGECRHPEDFDWDGPVITCHAHGAFAPGWAYTVEVGTLAHRNPEEVR